MSVMGSGRRSQSKEKETRKQVVKAVRDEDGFIDKAPGVSSRSARRRAPNPTGRAVRAAKPASLDRATHRYANYQFVLTSSTIFTFPAADQ